MKRGTVRASLEARLEQARGAILQAIVAPAGWDAALVAFAEACGGRTGQLIVRDDAGTAVLHRLTGVPEDLPRVIESLGLADPQYNPRLSAGLGAALMTPCVDEDYVDAIARRRLPIYAELFDPMGFTHNCQIVLMRERGMLVRASVSRTKRQGPFDREALRTFEALAPYLRVAVQTRMALGLVQMQSTLRVLDMLEVAAFLLDARGRVLGASMQGELAALRGDRVAIAGGRLRPRDAAARDLLAARLPSLVRDGDASPPFSLRLPGAMLDVRPLPPEREGLGSGPAALAVLREPRTPRERLDLFGGAHGLTAAEAEVALALADGLGLDAIARDRGVSLATVRSQLRAVYAKLGIRRQAELVARLQRS